MIAAPPASLLASSFLALFLSWYLVGFLRNLRAARASGLPYVCRPVYEFNHVFALLEPVVMAVLDRLPDCKATRWGYFYLTARDWRIRLKHTAWHKHVGDVFVVVSPTMLSVEIADPEVQLEIGNRRTEFVRPTWMMAVVEKFGPNIVTTEDEDWRRHRRIIPQHFTNIYPFVWERGLTTTKEMLRSWKLRDAGLSNENAPPSNTINFMSDVNSMGLRINVSSIFGQPLPFKPFAETNAHESDGAIQALSHGITENAVEDYTAAIHTALENFVTILAIHEALLRVGMKTMKKIAQDAAFVHQFLKEAVRLSPSERRPSTPTPKGDRISIFDKLVDDGMKGRGDSGVLKESEVIGDIFMLTLAGSGSTSDTVALCLVLLALHQDVQEWVHEEIAARDGCRVSPNEPWSYEDGSSLVRPLCVLLETLRLYPTQLALTSWNPNSHSTIKVGEKSCTLPPKTMFNVNLPGLHYNPKHWGKDFAQFWPQRWLQQGLSTPQAPVTGAFAAFSRGAHSCLGRRFSEMVATSTMVGILRDHRITLSPSETTGGDAKEQAVWKVMYSLSHFTLGMREDVKLKFILRG